MRAQLKWVVGLNTFEICVTNADGTHLVQPTDKALFEGTGGVVRRWAESRFQRRAARRLLATRSRYRLSWRAKRPW